MNKLHAHIHMGAVKELLYEIDTAVGYIDKKAAIQTLEANAQGYLRQSIAIIDSLLETVEKLRQRNGILREALEKSDTENERVLKRNREVCELANERVGVLVEALTWYGNKGNYKVNVTDQWEPVTPIDKDAGQRARSLLSFLSTIEGGKADASS